MTTPRGIRNNNPGNIVQSGIAWRGKLANPTDPRFEQFDTPLNGIRALAKLLLSYQDRHSLRTPRGIINRWAPPVENDSLAYAKAFGDALGVGIDETVDLHRPNTLLAATTAIIRHENGQQPYTDAEIDAGLVLAGVEPPHRPLARTRTVQGGQMAAGASVGGVPAGASISRASATASAINVGT